MAVQDPLLNEVQRELRSVRPPSPGQELPFVVAGLAVKSVPDLRYPIESREALLDQIGHVVVTILGHELPTRALISRAPAAVFPIASKEALAKLIMGNLHRRPEAARLWVELDALSAQLEPLIYPLGSREAFAAQLKQRRTYRWRGKPFVADLAVRRLAPTDFPISSPLELKLRIAAAAVAREMSQRATPRGSRARAR